MSKDSMDSFLPLSPATLHILLALAGEKLHGYAIMQEIARQSEGRYKPGPGILYDNLQRLTRQGIVTHAGQDLEDPRRLYYKLTALGRRVLSTEISRLEDVVREARQRLPIRARGEI